MAWNGSLPSAKIVKERGGIVFGTPWSPPGEYKTNGTAQGGNSADQGNQEGRLRLDCYDKFFPWLNTYLQWMHDHGVDVDAVSVQNEPDWWVSYSGCLYTPDEQLNLVKNYAHMLDRETYNGVRLISAEPLGFDPAYSNKLLNDPTAREQIDIIAGHIYGHPPLNELKSSASLAKKYGKEVWMTEHSISDNIGDRLPNWDEQLDFAREVNECLQAGCTGYIYWYMRAHWSFVSTGESKYGEKNRVKNRFWLHPTRIDMQLRPDDQRRSRGLGLHQGRQTHRHGHQYPQHRKKCHHQFALYRDRRRMGAVLWQRER